MASDSRRDGDLPATWAGYRKRKRSKPGGHMPDEFQDLLRRAAEGSDEARQELLRLYGPHIRRVIRRRLERGQQALFDQRDFVAELWPSVLGPGQIDKKKDARPETVLENMTETLCSRVINAFSRQAANPGDGGAGNPGGNPAGPHVLVAEDDDAVGRMLEYVLRDQGFEVTVARGGQQAVDQYRAHGETYDAVLLDVQMPGLDGPQTLAALRQINPDVRCCFMSGNTGEYSAEELLRLGAARVLPKPFLNLKELGQALREVAAW